MGIKNTTKKIFTSDESKYQIPQVSAPREVEIMMRTPWEFKDVQEYGEALLKGKVVMLNLERLDGANRNRVFDYLNGVAYIIKGTVDVVTEDMLIYCPQGVSVDKKVEEDAGPNFWP